MWRERIVSPVPLSPIETPILGRYFNCMAQIYPADRGQNYAVWIGWQAAALIADRHR